MSTTTAIPTSRRRFLALTGALLAAPFATRAAGCAPSDVSFDALTGLVANAQQVTARGGPVIADALKRINAGRRFGYVSVGVEDKSGQRLFDPGNWTVYVNGATSDLHIQRCNDAEGWFEHFVSEPIELGQARRDRTIHVKADVRLVYRGTDPRYTHFTDQPQTPSA